MPDTVFDAALIALAVLLICMVAAALTPPKGLTALPIERTAP